MCVAETEGGSATGSFDRDEMARAAVPGCAGGAGECLSCREVAGDHPRTREAVSRVLEANGGTEMRGVTGVRSHPKKEANFSGRGSPPGEHTSCYVSTAGSRVGVVLR